MSDQDAGVPPPLPENDDENRNMLRNTPSVVYFRAKDGPVAQRSARVADIHEVGGSTPPRTTPGGVCEEIAAVLERHDGACPGAVSAMSFACKSCRKAARVARWTSGDECFVSVRRRDDGSWVASAAWLNVTLQSTHATRAAAAREAAVALRLFATR